MAVTGELNRTGVAGAIYCVNVTRGAGWERERTCLQGIPRKLDHFKFNCAAYSHCKNAKQRCSEHHDSYDQSGLDNHLGDALVADRRQVH